MKADKAGQGRGPKVRFVAEFTDQEMNYLWMALNVRAHDLEKGPLRDAGNVPYVRNYCRKLMKKIERIRREAGR